MLKAVKQSTLLEQIKIQDDKKRGIFTLPRVLYCSVLTGERLPTLTMEQSDPEPGPDAIEEPQYDAEEQAEPRLMVIEEPQPGPSKRQRLI
ncbi:uncharacterized protein [Diabrotica undecimpunctata]|uniref:uncharacterized protein isoform X3 n=1 Tax=Diabrotica undecimpunctata TaxID=50387 RepID=UPI003B64001E